MPRSIGFEALQAAAMLVRQGEHGQSLRHIIFKPFGKVGGLFTMVFSSRDATQPVLTTKTHAKKILAPSLKSGDIVVMDNLSSHKVKGVREAIKATGAFLLYLPPYSPDINSIELAFSKLMALLRKATVRFVDDLCEMPLIS